MRSDKEKKTLIVRCNSCGKDLKTSKGIVMEGVVKMNVDWGYFSNKDGEVHKLDICEKCYDEWIKSFKIPIDVVRKTEML